VSGHVKLLFVLVVVFETHAKIFGEEALWRVVDTHAVGVFAGRGHAHGQLSFDGVEFLFASFDHVFDSRNHLFCVVCVCVCVRMFVLCVERNEMCVFVCVCVCVSICVNACVRVCV